MTTAYCPLISMKAWPWRSCEAHVATCIVVAACTRLSTVKLESKWLMALTRSVLQYKIHASCVVIVKIYYNPHNVITINLIVALRNTPVPSLGVLAQSREALPAREARRFGVTAAPLRVLHRNAKHRRPSLAPRGPSSSGPSACRDQQAAAGTALRGRPPPPAASAESRMVNLPPRRGST